MVGYLMSNSALVITGSVLIAIWGISHIVPTRSVVSGVGPLSRENKFIITMEWIAEGLALCFIGVSVLLTWLLFGGDNSAVLFVLRLSSVMLLCMAVLSLFTGARSSVIPIKICPVVKTLCAILIFAGTF